MIILAILLPLLAVFLATKNPIRAGINFLLWCCFLLPGIVHAIICVNEAKTGKMIREASRR